MRHGPQCDTREAIFILVEPFVDLQEFFNFQMPNWRRQGKNIGWRRDILCKADYHLNVNYKLNNQIQLNCIEKNGSNNEMAPSTSRG